MNIRLLALGSRGDVQPYVALGLGLQKAGYDVTVAVTSNFKSWVESYSLPTLTAEVNMQEVVQQGQSRRAARKAKWVFFQVLLDETLRLSEGADLLVYGPAAIFSAPHVVEKLGIPAIPTALQTFLHPTGDVPAVGMPTLALGAGYNRFTYAFVDWLTWTFTKKMVNRWRKNVLGLTPAVRSPMSAMREAHVPTLYGISPAVLPKPPEWGSEAHLTGYWFLSDLGDWQPTPELARFVEGGSPPVYVGFGSMASRDPQETARIVLEAIKMAGVRAVIASGWGGLSAANAPENVLVIDSAPHDWLLPRMSAAVHHGGAGTTGASLRAGLPTVIVPFKSDQPFWGKRVFDLGAGPQPIPRGQLTADKLADAIRVAVGDQTIRAKAADLGERIRAEDGVGNAVRLIQEISQHPPAPIRLGEG
jgi:sterol 3beta-glucosyltransferase